jgi:hypothetical protein
VKREHHRAAAVTADDRKKPHSVTFDELRRQPDVTIPEPMVTPLLKSITNCDNAVTEVVDALITPPILVAEDTNATLESSCTVSDSRQLVTLSGNNNNIVNTCATVAISSRSVNMVAAAARDATELAQSIRVTQAVFSQHGLDSTLATEWAMRRQESELSVCGILLGLYVYACIQSTIVDSDALKSSCISCAPHFLYVSTGGISASTRIS